MAFTNRFGGSLEQKKPRLWPLYLLFFMLGIMMYFGHRSQVELWTHTRDLYKYMSDNQDIDKTQSENMLLIMDILAANKDQINTNTVHIAMLTTGTTVIAHNQDIISNIVFLLVQKDTVSIPELQDPGIWAQPDYRWIQHEDSGIIFIDGAWSEEIATEVQ